MTQLTGFGVPTMPQSFQHLEDRYSNTQQRGHQEHNTSHPQVVPHPQQAHMPQGGRGGFLGEGGIMPYVKIIEEPAKNNLRFR